MIAASGMTFAGLVASGFSPNPIANTNDQLIAIQALPSDSLPASMLFITIETPPYEVTAEIDQALRAAHIKSSRVVEIL